MNFSKCNTEKINKTSITAFNWLFYLVLIGGVIYSITDSIMSMDSNFRKMLFDGLCFALMAFAVICYCLYNGFLLSNLTPIKFKENVLKSGVCKFLTKFIIKFSLINAIPFVLLIYFSFSNSQPLIFIFFKTYSVMLVSLGWFICGLDDYMCNIFATKVANIRK